MLSYYGISAVLEERINNDVLNSNRAGIIFSYAALMCLLIYDIAKKRVYVILLVLLGLGVMITGSKAALGSLVIEIIVFQGVKSLFEGGKKKIRDFCLMIIMILLVFYLITSVPSLYNIIGKRLLDFLGNMFKGTTVVSRSTIMRRELIEAALPRFLQRPIQGWGIGNFSYLNQYNTYAHSNIVQLLADTGIVGAVLFYMNYFIIFLRTRKLRNRDAKAFLYAFLGSSFFLSLCSVNFNEISDIMVVFLCAAYLRYCDGNDELLIFS
jgi:O-antigen ligase